MASQVGANSVRGKHYSSVSIKSCSGMGLKRVDMSARPGAVKKVESSAKAMGHVAIGAARKLYSETKHVAFSGGGDAAKGMNTASMAVNTTNTAKNFAKAEAKAATALSMSAGQAICSKAVASALHTKQAENDLKALNGIVAGRSKSTIETFTRSTQKAVDKAQDHVTRAMDFLNNAKKSGVQSEIDAGNYLLKKAQSDLSKAQTAHDKLKDHYTQLARQFGRSGDKLRDISEARTNLRLIKRTNLRNNLSIAASRGMGKFSNWAGNTRIAKYFGMNRTADQNTGKLGRLAGKNKDGIFTRLTRFSAGMESKARKSIAVKDGHNFLSGYALGQSRFNVKHDISLAQQGGLPKMLNKKQMKLAKRLKQEKKLANKSRANRSRSLRGGVRGVKNVALSAPKTLVGTVSSVSGMGGETMQGYNIVKKTMTTSYGAGKKIYGLTKKVTMMPLNATSRLLTRRSVGQLAKQGLKKATVLYVKGVGTVGYHAVNLGTMAIRKPAAALLRHKGKYQAAKVVEHPLKVTARVGARAGKAAAAKATKFTNKMRKLAGKPAKAAAKKAAKASAKTAKKVPVKLSKRLIKVTAKLAFKALKLAAMLAVKLLGLIVTAFMMLFGTVGGIALIVAGIIAIFGVIFAQIKGPGVSSSSTVAYAAAPTGTQAQPTQAADEPVTWTLGWTTEYLNSLSQEFYDKIKTNGSNYVAENSSRHVQDYLYQFYDAKTGGTMYTTMDDNYVELLSELYIWADHNIEGTGKYNIDQLKEHLKERYWATHGIQPLGPGESTYQDREYSATMLQHAQDYYEYEVALTTLEYDEDTGDYVEVPVLDDDGNQKYDTVSGYTPRYEYNPETGEMEKVWESDGQQHLYYMVKAYILKDKESIFGKDDSSYDFWYIYDTPDGLDPKMVQEYELFADDENGVGFFSIGGAGLSDYENAVATFAARNEVYQLQDENGDYGGLTIGNQGSMVNGRSGVEAACRMAQGYAKTGETDKMREVVGCLAGKFTPSSDPHSYIWYSIKYKSGAGKASKLNTTSGCDEGGYIWQLYSTPGMPQEMIGAFGGCGTYAEYDDRVKHGGWKKTTSPKIGDVVRVKTGGNTYCYGILVEGTKKDVDGVFKFVSYMTPAGVTRLEIVDNNGTYEFEYYNILAK